MLPKRVVDVNPDGKSGSLRLLETKGLRGNFIALSHRWGSAEEMPLRTTTQNLKDHLVQIDATRLSKTFRDAIAVARAVDVRYLWIDSLCIIQDDLTDWEVEAESMGQIYEHALFTIAASTQFIASHEGLFFCLQTDFDRVEMPYFNPEGVVEGVFTVANWSQDLMQNPVASALSKRGWATQEWILSRRMVHYMDDSFSWVCNGLQKTAQNHLGVDTDLDEFHGNDWQQIVRLYTQRQLTFEKDRLAAIRGLASRFEQLRQHDRYLHGMWQEQLIQQLAWQKGEDDLKKNTSLPKVPSWSWASRIGPIKPVWTGDLNDEWESDCVLHEIDHCGVLKMEGRLLAAKKCGYLNLNAANFQTTWATEDPLFGADLWVDKFCLLSSNSGVGLGYIILDMPADPRTEYFAALLGRRLHHFSTQYENNNEAEKRRRSRGLTSEIRDEGFSCDVLILSRSSLRGTYERVGMGKVVSHLFSRFSCESSQKFRIC